MASNASNVRADRSFSCSLGTRNASRMPKASATFIAAAVRLRRARLAMGNDLLDHTIQFLLCREAFADLSAECYELIPSRIPE